MSNTLLGFALISASLQTAWAVMAEGQLLVLPAVAVALAVGARYLLGGVIPRRLYRS